MALSALLSVACGETSRNGGEESGPSSGGTTGNDTQGGANSTASTLTNTQGVTNTLTNGVTSGVTNGATSGVTAVSAGGANGATGTDGAVSTTSHVGGGGGAAGGGSEPECGSDDDCRLFSDCCTCAAHPASGEAPPACPADCAQGRCEQYAIEQVRCFAGSCIVATPHACSPLPVQCDSPPPECPDGTLASVGDDRCWTGACVPSELCSWRPDCSSCAKEEVCFRGFNDAFGTPYYCMPRPVTCSGQATCGCASQLCEELGFGACTDANDGVMQCSP